MAYTNTRSKKSSLSSTRFATTFSPDTTAPPSLPRTTPDGYALWSATNFSM